MESVKPLYILHPNNRCKQLVYLGQQDLTFMEGPGIQYDILWHSVTLAGQGIMADKSTCWSLRKRLTVIRLAHVIIHPAYTSQDGGVS